MKIVLVSAGFRPENLRLQPHRTILEMSRQLHRRGHSSVVVTDGAEGCDDEGLLNDVRVRRTASVRNHQFSPDGRNNALVAAIAAEHPDLVLWHLSLSTLWHQDLTTSIPWPVIGILSSPIHHPIAILRLGWQKLSSNIDLVVPQLAGALLPGALIRRAFAAGGLTGMIALSGTTRSFLVQRGAPAQQTWVVSPGVDREWSEATPSSRDRSMVREKLGLADDDFVVTYFGSPAPVRGIFTLIQAAGSVARRHPKLRLLLLTRRWPHEWRHQVDRLNVAAKQDGPAKTCIVDGYVGHADLVSYLAGSDAICLPFELVPSDVPLSILESMALGHAVVTTNVACIPELVGDQRGFLVPPGRPAALAEELTRLIDEPSERIRRGRRARAHVRAERSWDHMGNALDEVLTHVH